MSFIPNARTDRQQQHCCLLLEKEGAWLAEHPEKEMITRRYLRNRPSLYREALARLAEAEPDAVEDELAANGQAEESLERTDSLNVGSVASFKALTSSATGFALHEVNLEMYTLARSRGRSLYR